MFYFFRFPAVAIHVWMGDEGIAPAFEHGTTRRDAMYGVRAI